jgi:hypothetical protein
MDEPVRYEYRDQKEKLRYAVLRYGHGPGKRFEILGGDGSPWADPIPPAKRMLYRLPELLRAPPAETIFLVEGEKDVEALAEQGLVATTMPCGTRGGWLDTYNHWLGNRHVVILPDNDGPGRRHAEKVRTSLAGNCLSVLIVSLAVPADWMTSPPGWHGVRMAGPRRPTSCGRSCGRSGTVLRVFPTERFRTSEPVSS